MYIKHTIGTKNQFFGTFSVQSYSLAFRSVWHMYYRYEVYSYEKFIELENDRIGRYLPDASSFVY